LQELVVFLARGEVAAFAQTQFLIERPLEVVVRRLGVAVLVSLTRIGLLALHLVVIEQGLVTLAELPLFAEVVDRRRKAVAAHPLRHAAELVKGALQSGRHRLERLAGADAHRLGVGVGEHAVKQEMWKGAAGDRHLERSRLGEVETAQPTGRMDLLEDHRFGAARQGAPTAHATFEASPLGVGEAARMLALQLGEESHRFKPRIGDEPRFDTRPNVDERILTGAPRAWRAHPRGASQFPVTAGRFLIHVRPPCRLAQSVSLVQPPLQRPNLSVRDHATPSSKRKPPILPKMPSCREF